MRGQEEKVVWDCMPSQHNTELRTPFIFSSNTHLFKGTEGHFYQFRKKHLIFWVITNCTFLLFQGKAFNFLGNYK